jgi:hypothetical protein
MVWLRLAKGAMLVGSIVVSLFEFAELFSSSNKQNDA